MEEKHRDLLLLHRSKFAQSVDVERLIPFLQATDVLSADDTDDIRNETSPSARVHKLLDILPVRGNQAFQTLCLSLETTYPHLLTVMFLGNSTHKVSESSTTVLTSDSEVEDISKLHGRDKDSQLTSAAVSSVSLDPVRAPSLPGLGPPAARFSASSRGAKALVGDGHREAHVVVATSRRGRSVREAASPSQQPRLFRAPPPSLPSSGSTSSSRQQQHHPRPASLPPPPRSSPSPPSARSRGLSSSHGSSSSSSHGNNNSSSHSGQRCGTRRPRRRGDLRKSSNDSAVRRVGHRSDTFSLDFISSHPESFGSQDSTRLFSTPSPLSPSEYDLQQNNLALLKAELKLVTHDRDSLRKELRKVQTERDVVSRRLAMNSGEPSLSRLGTLTKQHGVSNSDKSLSASRDYDRLKSQCDQAMSELQSLRLRCDAAMRDSEFYRSKHRQAMSKLDKQQTEALSLRTQYNEILADKHRLEQEVANLQKFREEDRKEVADLRKHQQEAINENGNSEAINQMYITTLRKYEAIKDDYDSLRKRYTDLYASRSATVSKLELAQEEVTQLKKQYEEVIQDRNGIVRERNGLKQQCTAAIHQWDNALRELNEVKEAFAKVQQQRDEAMKEINQAMAVRIKATKDLARLTEERNAAVQEYSLVMLERDSVHKEIEKLQEELTDANKKIKSSDLQKKVTVEEIETLRREIASALHDRDRALKECNDLREKYGDYVTARDDGNSRERDEVRRDYDAYRRELARKSRSESLDRQDSSTGSLGANDSYSKGQKERLENLDVANQEIDRLRKQLEKLQTELNEAQQEAEVSKRRRDWAFSERDKIVLERESIRTLCDKLRRERDRAVSDLAEALRDSDDIKKQRNEASKELKELREKIEAQMEKESRMKQLNTVGHNHSRDSAIDADLQEWETETLEFDMGGSSLDALGFDLAGGKDDSQYPDSSIFISSITKGSVADGKLKVNDTIVRVNNVDLTNAEKSKVYDAVKNGGGVINMVVRRRRSTSSRFVQTVHLNLSSNKEHGISLESGLYISRIAQGSVAAKEGNLAVGDRIISIGGKSVDGVKSSSEGLKLLEATMEVLTILVAKCISNPSAPVSSSSSGHNIVENIDGEKMNGPCNFPSSPVKEASKPGMRDASKKLTTSSSQTEDVHLFSKKQTSVSPTTHPTQQTFLDRAYHKFFRERRSGKERHEKKVSRNSSPSPVHEEEAIAELDSIIEQFKKNTPSSSKGSKGRKRKEKETEKNGGTWPRYRSAPANYVEQCKDTMMNSHRKKERTSIASLMHPPKFWPAGMYGNKTPDERDHEMMGRSPPTDASSSDPGGPVYSVLQHGPQSSEASVMHALKTGPFLSNGKSPFYPPSPGNLPSKVDGKATESGSLHYSPVSSLDSPLDYSVVSADKTVLEYYRNKGKTRPKSAHYPQSDSESFSATDSPTSVKPSSLDILSPYSKPLHLSSSSMSSGRGVMSPHLNERQTQHVRASSQSNPQSSLLRSPPNGMAYFPVSGGRVPHSHTSHTHPHNTISCTSPTSSSPRYSSPPTVAYTSRSGESLLSSSIPETSPISDPRLYPRLEGRYSHNPSTSSSPYSFSHSPSQSIELQHYHPAPGAKRLVPKHSHAPYREELSGYGSYDGPSTFPKRTHQQRIRIPSNQSVTSTKSSAGKVSTSSIEKASTSERGSPMPAFLVEVVNPGTGTVTSSMPDFRNKKVAPGALRSICIQKSAEPLGIQIDCGSRGGIFVSSVSENSLASQAGLQIGDQLLEVCGINMRSATYLLAANVLRQCGDSITMLVQYSPDKFKEAIGSSTSSSSSTGSSTHSDGSPAPTPTPSSSPKTPHKQSKVVDLTDSLPPSATSTLTRPTNSAGTSITDEQSSSNGAMHEPRRVFLKKTTSNLGVSLLGGNAVGIFVHAVQPDSPASGPNGLRCGDQILEYNGADLRSATAEQAASELAKPADTVSILAQYNYARYLEIQGQAGDSFYIRAMFDRTADSPDELSFRKDAILYVDNTMLNGVSGMWRAWLVNEDGQKRQCGVIPSKYKVDEELLLKRSLGDLDSDSGSRRGSTSARRSFFRRKKHQRSNSRDSKELASFSDVSINSYSDSGTLAEDPSVATYQRVERLDYLVLRPVLIVGPLIEVVVDKLVQDFPHKFQRCLPEIFRGSQQLMEKGIQDHIFVDYRRRGSHFECITVAAVKEICDKNTHCIIDVSPQSVERLHRLQIYPIVLFIKFKSTKQIREVKDSTFLTEKVSTKAAKEMYEHSLKIESEYKHVISAVIPGGCLAYMCAQIEAYVDQEQSKTLWVPAGTI